MIVKHGYRHLDCASVYDNEAEIGSALGRAMKDANIQRGDMFIVSKLWSTSHSREHVKESCLKTLKDLQIDYLDLYLVHWPLAFEHPSKSGKGFFPKDSQGNMQLAKVPLQETWEAMEGLVKEGLVRSIGVSNYVVAHLLDMFSYAKIMPTVNQIELHPYNTREELVEFCQKNNIAITAYSSLGSGKVGPLQDKVVQSISEKYQKTPAQILLRWGIEKGYIVIPRSHNEERQRENMDIFNFKLSAEDIKTIDGLNRNWFCIDSRSNFNLPLFAV